MSEGREKDIMVEYSKCPKCGGDRLKYIGEIFTDYDCEDCHQRMDKRDYAEWVLKNFVSRIDMELIFDAMFEGVNNERRER